MPAPAPPPLRPAPTRREALVQALALSCTSPGILAAARRLPPRGAAMRFGLVTWMWGADYALPDLLQVCERTGIKGLELRTTQLHGVERDLGAAARAQVKARFAAAPVELVGIGSDERFDDPDPAKLEAAIQASLAFLQLSHDVGGSGVKVKPDSFHAGVPRERTIEQIGRSLNKLGRRADDLGQQVRLEVHGQCAELPTIHAILQVADHPSVVVCWNSNAQDLAGAGLAHNFELVRARLGDTLHARDFTAEPYPYPELFTRLVAADWQGWVLLEAHPPVPPRDEREAALLAQRQAFETLRAKVLEPAAVSGGRLLP
ncbi:MAG TPA: TIM barrel protein [Planctomycetota bacterium]